MRIVIANFVCTSQVVVRTNADGLTFAAGAAAARREMNRTQQFDE
jgi:hypothetical protein